MFEIPFRRRCEVDGFDKRDDRSDAADQVIDAEVRYHRYRACPECSARPVRVVGSGRVSVDAALAIFAVGCITGLGLILNVTPLEGFATTWALVALAALPALQLFGHVLIARTHGWVSPKIPVRGASKLKPVSLDPGRDDLPRRFQWPSRNPGYSMLAVAALAALPAMLFYISIGGDVDLHTRSGLIGPGDRVKVALETRLTSLRRVWGGTASGTITLPDAPPLPIHVVVPPVSRVDNTMFTTKDALRTFNPEVEFDIPDDPALGGRTITVDLVVQPSVAVLAGGVDVQQAPEIRERVSVKVAPAVDMARFRILRWICAATTALLAAGASFWFFRCDQRMQSFPRPNVFISKGRSHSKKPNIG